MWFGRACSCLCGSSCGDVGMRVCVSSGVSVDGCVHGFLGSGLVDISKSSAISSRASLYVGRGIV